MKQSLLLVLCCALVGCSRSPSNIRVQNLTGHDFSEVIVMTNSFGAVRAGTTSYYQIIRGMFQSASVYTREPSGYFRNDRFMGGANAELTSGSYTYVLTLSTNDMLEVTLKKDL